jgi:hypothetical protein
MTTAPHFTAVPGLWKNMGQETKETEMERKEKKVSIEEWTTRFRAVGLDDAAMGHWHTLFERENPSGHQGFLEWLGLPEEHILQIRNRSSIR